MDKYSPHGLPRVFQHENGDRKARECEAILGPASRGVCVFVRKGRRESKGRLCSPGHQGLLVSCDDRRTRLVCRKTLDTVCRQSLSLWDSDTDVDAGYTAMVIDDDICRS
jgi:hypothetical protein